VILIARCIVVSIACLVLLSCATHPKEPNDPVYIYDGGRVSVVDDYGDCFISIDGSINPHLEKAFTKAKAYTDSLECIEKIVLIRSNGGDLDSAMRIGKQIRAGKFSTDMHGYCESACAFIYIGGIRRFAHQNSRIVENSKLGVHQPASELLFRKCVVNNPQSGPVIQVIRQYLALMLPSDASAKLSKEMFETSCNHISYIDANGLLRSGIATESVDFH
jgi:hypothetical protein